MRARRLLRLAALAGSASIMLGSLALAGPASAAPLSPHPMPAAVPHDFITDTVTSLSLSASSVEFDQEPSLKANFSVFFKNRQVPTPVPGGAVILREVLANGTQVDLCSDDSIGSDGTGSCNLTTQELTPGSYQVIASYEGILHVANHSDSGQQTLTVAKEPTTVTMTNPSSTVPFGQESTDPFTLRAFPRTSGTPSGGGAGVDFKGAGGFNTIFCGATLVNGTATCAETDTGLPPGAYQVFGFYNGDDIFAGSDTPLETLTITPGTAVATLSLGQPRIDFGQQQNEQLTVHVAPIGSGAPSGQVTVMEGNANICGATLAGGVGECQLNPGQLAVGRHALTASYSGDTDFNGTTSTAQTLIVTAKTTTALGLSQARVKFGREQAEKLTVTVKSTISGTGTPGGTVTITAGNNTLCRAITLHSGTASCTLTARRLRAGTYHLTARYAGATSFTGSTSQRKTLTVTR